MERRMAESAFKVVVIGGGPSGLTLAHALHRAGIDFVILELRENVLQDVGASLVISPENHRVFHQFGILDKLLEIGEPVYDCRGLLANGQEFKRNFGFDVLHTNHGIRPVAYHRAELVEVLYNALPEEAKSKYLTGKKLADITPTENGVEVTCVDGSTYSGSFAVGADGVHSKTRNIMRNLATAESPKVSWDVEDPYTSTYKCLWASFPRQAEPGQYFEVNDTDRSIMHVTGKQRGWIFLFQKLPKATSKSSHYNEDDIKAHAEAFANMSISDSLKVKDVFPLRTSAGMADLGEGIVKRWSWGGKIVLIGDSCHKFTPNAGMGLNNGVQDVVALCNRLRKASLDKKTSTENLKVLFEEYQKERIASTKESLDISAHLTRLHAWANGLYYFAARYLLSIDAVHHFVARNFLSPSIKKGLVFDYISCNEPLTGKVPWDHPLEAPAEKN